MGLREGCGRSLPAAREKPLLLRVRSAGTVTAWSRTTPGGLQLSGEDKLGAGSGPGPHWLRRGTTSPRRAGEAGRSARRSGRPLQGCGLGTQERGGHQLDMTGRTHPCGAGLQWSQRSRVPSRGGGCPEEGTEGELRPRAGAACSLQLCSPLPLGALQERHAGAKPKPKGPLSLQGLPLRQEGDPGIGDIPGQSQPGKSPRCSPAPG